MALFLTDYARMQIARAQGAEVKGPQDAMPTGDAKAPVTGEHEALSFERLWRMAENRLSLGTQSPSLVKDIQGVIPKPSFRLFSPGASWSWRSVNQAAKAAQGAMAHLDRIPASDFSDRAAGAGKKYAEAVKRLETAVKAQAALKQALVNHEKHAPADARSREARENLMLACDRRQSEMLAMAAQLLTRRGGLEGVTVRDAMRALSLEMHGNKDVMEAAWNQGTVLFRDLDALDQTRQDRPPDFLQKAENLRRRFDELRDTVEKALHGTTASSPRILRDRTPFEPLLRSLEASMARLQELTQPPDKILDLGTLLDQVMDLKPLEKTLRPLLPSFERDKTPVLEELGTLKKNMLEQLRHGDMDLNALRGALDRILARIEHAIKRSGGPDNRARMDDWRTLKCAMQGLGLSANSTVRDIWKRELEDTNAVARAMRGQTTGPHQTERYLALAAQSPLGLATLVECSLRDIAPDSIETRCDPQALVATRPLGAGAVNAVTLCEYGQGAERVSLVFKPEHEARFGLNRLSLNRLGYSHMTRVVELNTASCYVAGQIGCGGVVARSKAGCLDGRFGLFMELAPGRTAGDWSERYKKEMRDTATKLRCNGLLEAARANLQRELCKLEWADLLSGQGDRHQNNYLVDINRQTGAVRITGIDNDASFGQGHLGPNMVEYYDHDLGKTVRKDVSGMDGKDLAALRKNTGLNQLIVPAFIDQSTFNHLMAIDKHAYEAQLRLFLRNDGKAVASAMRRLTDAQALAGQLQSQHRVIDNWKDARVGRASLHTFYEQQHAQLFSALGAMRFLREGFYARDCLTLLS